MTLENNQKIIIILILITIIILFYFAIHAPKVESQTPIKIEWKTLGLDPYRSSFINNSIAGEINPNQLSVKWYYVPSSYYSIDSQPLIADLNNDSNYEIIFKDSSGMLYILDNQGNLLQQYFSNGFWSSTPLIMDLDNDGYYEIIVGTKNGKIEALDINPTNYQITKLWSTQRLDTFIVTSPLASDIDNDGQEEIIVVTTHGVYSINSASGAIKWHYSFNEPFYSGSAVIIGDVNANNSIDIAVVSAIGNLYVIDGMDGSLYWNYTLWDILSFKDKLVIHSLAAGDIDGDGSIEVVVPFGREVFTSSGGRWYRSSFEGTLAIIHPSSKTIDIVNHPQNKPLFLWFSQPAMALGDVDGDGQKEIFLASADGWLYRIDYSGGSYSFTWSKKIDTCWSYEWYNSYQSDAPTNAFSIAVADIDGDNNYEVIVVGTSDDTNPTSCSYNTLTYRIDIIDSSLGTQKGNTLIISYLGNNNKYMKYSWPTLAIGDLNSNGALDTIVLPAHETLVAVG